MAHKKNKKNVTSYWLVLIAPLLAFPFMINLRVFPFVAPNEEPKWAVLTLCALWIGLASAWLWFKKTTPLKITKPSIPAYLLAIYTIILAIGIFIGPNMTEGMVRFSFWFFCILIFILSAWATQHEKGWASALFWSVSFGSFIFSIRYWDSYFHAYGEPNYNISVLFSPIGHVNFTGDVLIMLLPMLIYILVTLKNPVLRVINWFSIATVATVLLVASSRGALGGLFIAACIFLILIAKHYRLLKEIKKKRKYQVSIALVVTALVASLATYSSLPYHYRDLARVSSAAGQSGADKKKIQLTPNVLQPPFVESWVSLSPILGARIPIFASTTAMALDKPFLGQGTGNYAWVYPNYSNRYKDFRDPLSSVRTFTTNPHNILLQIASQNGFIAMFIFLSLLLYFWFKLIKVTWHKWDNLHISGVTALTAVIFDAMFNHVFFNPASMFVFALLGGLWWGSLAKTKNYTFKIASKLASPMAALFLISLSVWPLRWIASEWNVGQAMAHVRQPNLEKNYYQKAYDWDSENFRAVFGMGQIAYKQEDYTQSIKYFEYFEEFFPYNPPALNMLGAAYMSNRNFRKAKDTFERALIIYPRYSMVEKNLARVNMILRQQQRSNFINKTPQN